MQEPRFSSVGNSHGGIPPPYLQEMAKLGSFHSSPGKCLVSLRLTIVSLRVAAGRMPETWRKALSLPLEGDLAEMVV